MSEKSSSEGHHFKTAAEISTGVGLAALAGAGGYALWRKQHREGRTFEATPIAYEHQLRVLGETRISPIVRKFLAPLAVRIHYATFNTAEQVVTREQLQYQLQTEQTHTLQKALSYMQDKEYDLIGRRGSAMDGRIQGYYSKPPLNWALEQGEIDSLAQAYAELTRELTGS